MSQRNKKGKSLPYCKVGNDDEIGVVATIFQSAWFFGISSASFLYRTVKRKNPFFNFKYSAEARFKKSQFNLIVT